MVKINDLKINALKGNAKEARKGAGPEGIGGIVVDMVKDLAARRAKQGHDAQPYGNPKPGKAAREIDGVFDLDLAEFPMFRFQRNRPGGSRDPLVYTDTIRGQDGKPVTRGWKAYPGPFGFGGATTQALLFDLLQLYREQGMTDARIRFGTLRSLLRRRGERNPSRKDYERIKRDLDILRGYDFHCTNAFWDAGRKAYVDMKWRLFGTACFYKTGAEADSPEAPHGFVEVSPVLQRIARTRGFLSLGFDAPWFHSLKPLEQRLAIYLSKKFVSQSIHRRFVSDLARALPIQAGREADVRKCLKEVAGGLRARGFAMLVDSRFERSVDGRWLIVFLRSRTPRRTQRRTGADKVVLTAEERLAVDRIVEAVGGEANRPWWIRCVQRVGAPAAHRALGLLKESSQSRVVRNPGGLLTRIFQDIAEDASTTASIPCRTTRTSPNG